MEQREHIKVLLVEDNPEDAELVQRSMRKIRSASLKVQWSPNLSSALEKLASEPFDVVVTDLGLPESKGIKSFLTLHAYYPDIPIIVLTGLSDEELAVQTVRSGAQDYLVKGDISGDLLLKSLRHSIERQRLMTEIENKLREIRRLERERNNILSTYAHDISNIVTPTAWAIKMILSGKIQNMKEHLVTILDSLDTAVDLLTDFEQFALFENSVFRAEKDVFNIEAEVLKQIEETRLVAELKNIKVESSLPEKPLPVVLADKKMLPRVFANLLNNAIKYTDPGGTVSLSVQSTGKEILFQIQDSGIGIPETHTPFIFDAFYRVSKDHKGSGLGLSIVKTIVEAHGGKIWVKSETDKGSIFSFTLPKK
ncbi:MAG: ATP-binding protein [Thermodesulfovibrionales bacterium]